MSEVDPDELPEHGWFDSESELPGISSGDPAIELGVNMSFPPVDFMQEDRVILTRNSNTTAPAPYQGCTMGHIPLLGIEPDKGENFIDAPNPSSVKLPSPIPFHCGWAMGRRGGIEREGGKSSTILLP